ncbi:ABC transporter ATP-binding protein, partial [Streptomyces sp. 110]|nr:ABC transporter ATP-binding protein [Streptomyces endocoffeicus]
MAEQTLDKSTQAERAEQTGQAVSGPGQVPTVIADDVHIVYRVNGGPKGKGSATAALSRLLGRKGAPGMREVHAVRGVTFVAYKGESIGLIGSN